MTSKASLSWDWREDDLWWEPHPRQPFWLKPFWLKPFLSNGTLLTRVVEGFLFVFPIDHWFACVRHGPVVISLRFPFSVLGSQVMSQLRRSAPWQLALSSLRGAL